MKCIRDSVYDERMRQRHSTLSGFPLFPAFLALLALLAAGVAHALPPATGSSLAAEIFRQGDPALVWFSGTSDMRGRDAELRDREGKVWGRTKLFSLPAQREEGRFAALFPLPFDIPPGNYGVFIGEGQESGSPTMSVKIEAGTFISEDIRLDAGNTALRTAPDPRKDAEWLTIKAVYDSVDPDAVFMDGKFGLPAGPVRRTAFFGDRRRYLYASGGTDTSIHTGIDFAVPSGSSVLAPARGRVVFAEKRIVTGLTLVVEHLPGMYSVFMHLSEFVAKPGNIVKRGDLIAKSGNTGLSTGPHLHWEIRVGGEPVNPDFFVAHSVSDPEGH